MQLAWQLPKCTLLLWSPNLLKHWVDNKIKRFRFLVISNVYTSLDPLNKSFHPFLMLLKQTCSSDDHTPDLITFVLIKAQHLFQLRLAHRVFSPPSVPPVSALISWARRKRSVTRPTLQTFVLFCSSVIIILTRGSFGIFLLWRTDACIAVCLNSFAFELIQMLTFWLELS